MNSEFYDGIAQITGEEEGCKKQGKFMILLLILMASVRSKDDEWCLA
jgi:hypothetical protein